MKLIEILKSLNFEQLKIKFEDLYPDIKDNIIEYENVFNTLLSLEPFDSKFQIKVETVQEQEDVPFEHSVINNRCDAIEKNGYIIYFQPCVIELETNELFSLSFIEWSELINSEIFQQTIEEFTKEEIVCHCIYDMTFYGFTMEEVRQVKNIIVDRAKEMEKSFKNDPSGKQFKSIEEIKEELLK